MKSLKLCAKQRKPKYKSYMVINETCEQKTMSAETIEAIQAYVATNELFRFPDLY